MLTYLIRKKNRNLLIDFFDLDGIPNISANKFNSIHNNLNLN